MLDTSLRLDNIDYLAYEKQAIVDACPKCKGLDFKCDCYRRYDLEVRKVRSNIPVKYRKAQLSDLTAKEIAKPKETLQAYLTRIKDHRRKGTGLYLWGSVGTAKTYSGCSVLIQALAKGYSAYFITLDSCIDNFIRNRNRAQTFAAVLESVSFLMIDDIGYAYRPVKDEIAYVDSILDRIMRQRCNNLLPIILTSQKSIVDMEETNSSGSRIASVVKEHMKRVQFSGPDFRNKMNGG